MWTHSFKDFDRLFVGFDKVADKLADVSYQTAKATSNYPPYNLKKIDENKYIIEMAVAGFGKQDIEVEIADDKLFIKGNVQSGEPSEQDSTGDWTWPLVLYQGLAMRPFTRTFSLADNVEISGASLLNGILKITLEAIIPEHKKPKKVETKEASRFVKSIDRKVKRGIMAAPKQLKEEVEELRSKNEEYKKALDLFRTKLNEVAVFNSNLAYATRLFTEHSTTKQEKINILRRFDDVETLKESKNLYRTIKGEISNDTITESVSLNESIERKVSNTPASGSAVNLIESKTYENPQFLRMKDLMGKIG
jgi:molecular chaperone IbpA